MKSLSSLLNAERITSRTSTSKARTYLQSVIEKYEPAIVWDNATLERDRAAFWARATTYAKIYGVAPLVAKLEWVRGKNLHPRQVLKVLK